MWQQLRKSDDEFILVIWKCKENNQTNAEPSCIYRQYVVAIPAILEGAGESKFCASLLEPSETMTMTVSLKSKELNTTLMQTVSKDEFHQCSDFEVRRRAELLHVCQNSSRMWIKTTALSQVPDVEKDTVMALEVEVQGDNFYSKEDRKVMIRRFRPESFIQTDKPIYLPGQTGNLWMIITGHRRTACCDLYVFISASALQTRLTGLQAEALCCEGESSSRFANNPRVLLGIAQTYW